MEETTTLSASAEMRPKFFKLIKLKIHALANSRAMLVSIFLYLLSLVALNISDSQIQKVAPGISKPDLVFGYTYTDIMDIFRQLGEAGRQAYLINLIVDSIMPVLFAAAVILVVTRAFPKFWLPLSIAPFLFFALDIIENAAFAMMVTQFPTIDPGLVAFTRPLTMVKLISFMIAVPSLGVGAIKILIGWIKAKRAAGK